MKAFFRKLGLTVLCRLCGVQLVDQRTGKVLGRVVVVRWKGGLRLIGLDGAAVRPLFLPQKSEVYWAQDLGFSTHAEPDFTYVKNGNCVDLPSVAAGGDGHGGGVAAPES